MVDRDKYESLFVADMSIADETASSSVGLEFETDIGCDLSSSMSLP